MGVLSYSLYLLHFAVLFAVERNLPQMRPILQGWWHWQSPLRWPG